MRRTAAMAPRVEGWTLTLVVLAVAAAAIAQPERVSQAIRPSNAPATAGVGVPFDLQGFIDHEINAGSKRMVEPPGCYRVTPRDRQHLLNIQPGDPLELVTYDGRRLTDAIRESFRARPRFLDFGGLSYRKP